MIKLVLAVVAVATSSIAFSTANASIVQDADKKIKVYLNDGDGMSYVIVSGEKVSVAFEEILKYPLDKNGKVRYEAGTTEGEPTIKAVYSEPGPPGLRYARPLSQLEVAKIKSFATEYAQFEGASALAMDPNADPGPVVDAFDALQGDRDCKITIYEKATDICGARFGRKGVVNWTMFDESVRSCGLFGCTTYREKYDFTVGYQSKDGRKTSSFRFVNGSASKRFIQVFSAWGGMTPKRI